jgi:hypothetical protein
MTRYTAIQTKDNITVTMVVDVNSTVNVSFLVTNSRGTSGYADITYYDSLGNKRTFSIPYYPGDVNRSTGALLQFPKPSANFDACFDILRVADCPAVPLAYITDVYVADQPVWNADRGQIAVPVYGFCGGIVYLIEKSQICETNYPLPKLGLKYTCYTSENIQYAYIHTYIPYHGSSETEIDYSKIALPDKAGGTLTASLGQKRGNWITDCELGYPTTSVNLQQVGFYQLVIPPGNGTANVNVPANCNLIMVKKYGYVYFDLIYNNSVIYSDYTDGYGWSGPVKFAGTGTVTVKYTNTLPANRALDFYFLNYSFKDPNTYFKFYVEGSKQTVTVNAAIVPSELIDEYCSWLNSRGILAVKEQPLQVPEYY